MSSAPPPPPYSGQNYYQQGPPLPPYSGQNYYQQGPPPAMTQPLYVGSLMTLVGDYPVQCTCPQCGKQIVSRVEKKNGILVWLICAALCLFFMWICCCIPFCMDSCKDTEHYCPSCNVLLGVNKKL